MKSEKIYALDIGSHKVTLAYSPHAGPSESAEFFVETVASAGIFKGVVNDLSALSACIAEVFKKMQARTGERPRQVVLSVSGHYIQKRNSVCATILSEWGLRSVTRSDIEKLTHQARSLGLELDESLLHEFAQGYSLDRQQLTQHPLGLHGRRFELDLFLICAKTSCLENLAKAVERAGGEVLETVFSGVAAAEAVLTKEERQKGIVLIDMGESLTEVLVFKGGIVKDVEILSFGGRNLTEILEAYLKVSNQTARSLQETSLEISRDISDSEEVMVKISEEYQTVAKSRLRDVVVPELESFLHLLKRVLSKNGVGDCGCSNIVVTGGLSLLEGFLERMEQSLEVCVKVGTVKGISHVPLLKTPAYAAAIGALVYYRRTHHKVFGPFPSSTSLGVGRVVDYFKNLYQDYF